MLETCEAEVCGLCWRLFGSMINACCCEMQICCGRGTFLGVFLSTMNIVHIYHVQFLPACSCVGIISRMIVADTCTDIRRSALDYARRPWRRTSCMRDMCDRTPSRHASCTLPKSLGRSMNTCAKHTGSHHHAPKCATLALCSWQ
jgi:hypothetical protein